MSFTRILKGEIAALKFLGGGGEWTTVNVKFGKDNTHNSVDIAEDDSEMGRANIDVVPRIEVNGVSVDAGNSGNRLRFSSDFL